MKILIIHYRYYEASGPETYLFNISKLLSEKGHVVIPFSLNFPENKETEYSRYFPTPILENFHINQQKKKISFVNKLKIIRDGFHNQQTYNCLQKLIADIKPNVAYVLQYGTKLSTSIFDVLSKNQIPVILRVSDFNLICAKNTFFRNGNICTECIKNKYSSVVHRCIHNSRTQSLAYYFIQKYNDLRHFENKIDAFISPSKFTFDLFTNTKQFNKSKFFHIPTFINSTNIRQSNKNVFYNIKDGIKLCYVGRVADDKGIDNLIDAINIVSSKGLNFSLDIIGDDNNEFAILQKQRIIQMGLQNIQFKGYIPSEKVIELYSNYHFSIIPSKWFDNMPNSLIESCINGIPVIASKIGSLQELIIDDFNGYTFEPFDPNSLATIIESLYLLDEDKYKILSTNAKHWITNHCNTEIHYNSLMNIINNLIDEKNNK